jgi:curved DNA-binding protein CbpA
MARTGDPYKTLGVSPGVSDADLRAAYRKLVQLHHPDHNGGSAESARRFEEVQEAYARIKELRASGSGAGARTARPGSSSARPGSTSARPGSSSARPGSSSARPGSSSARPRSSSARGSSTTSGSGSRQRTAGPPPRVDSDPEVESRLKDLERELREAQAATERARRAARDAVTESTGRASDEELGYVTTDDSFGKILADAGSEIVDRLSRAGDRIADASGQVREPVAKRVSDLLDELESLTSKLTGDSKRDSG